MSDTINFATMAERMAFIRGKHTEVVPKEVAAVEFVKTEEEVLTAEEADAEEVVEKPKKKAKRKTKKKEESDAVQAD